jgi:SAM-dependent methyltransferase
MHDNATIYELETTGYTRDLPFWLSLLDDQPTRTVLDLACGDGRITIPLAEQGRRLDGDFHITGLDISQPLITRANERKAALAPQAASAVDFIVGDMVEFDLDQRFDLIIIGFNSLMYVLELGDQLSCLRSVCRHLAPNGRFAFDILVPSLSYLSDAERTPAMLLEVDMAAPERGIKRFLRFATERYDAERQRDDTTYFYEIYYTDGRQERFTDDLAWHMYFPRELELLLCTAGLRPIAKYGNFQRGPFNRTSRQMIWVASAAGASEPDFYRTSQR